jgi:hypothetical protein
MLLFSRNYCEQSYSAYLVYAVYTAEPRGVSQIMPQARGVLLSEAGRAIGLAGSNKRQQAFAPPSGHRDSRGDITTCIYMI